MDDSRHMPLTPPIVVGDDGFWNGTARSYTGEVLDLTGATLTGHTRQGPGQAVLAEFTVTVVSPTAGTYRISLPRTESAKLVGSRRLMYDIRVVAADGTVTTVAYGNLDVVPSITGSVVPEMLAHRSVRRPRTSL